MIRRSVIMAFGRTIPTASSLLTGLNAYYKLDGGTATDSTGSGANGTVSGSTSSVTGKIGDALEFDNVNDYVEFADHASFHVGDVFSWALWLKRTRTNVTEELIGPATNGWEILFYASGSVPNGIQLAKSGVALIANSTATITDTNWHHTVVTKNGATVKIYVDGTEGTGTVTNATIVDTGVPWRLSEANNAAIPFVGTIDEVGLWNRDITSGEVTTLYNGGSGLTYPF